MTNPNTTKLDVKSLLVLRVVHHLVVSAVMTIYQQISVQFCLVMFHLYLSVKVTRQDDQLLPLLAVPVEHHQTPHSRKRTSSLKNAD